MKVPDWETILSFERQDVRMAEVRIRDEEDVRHGVPLEGFGLVV